MISSDKITVVVQGAIVPDEGRGTKEVCESIRTLLPRAEIILSTWENSNYQGIPYDKVLENKDPGALDSQYEGRDKSAVRNNFNRQLISTLHGIKEAEREYVMKLRSDSLLNDLSFLHFYEKYGGEQSIACFEPRNPWGEFLNQLSLCDFWFFAAKEKMLKLWDIPLYENGILKERDILGEEYLLGQFIGKKENLDLPVFLSDAASYRDTIYKNTLQEDFLIIPTRKSGIFCMKYPGLNDFYTVCIKHYVISFSDWISFQEQGKQGKQFLAFHFLQELSGTIFGLIKKIKRGAHGAKK
ncbi:WavE lipopolysaccharide synthesis family protein [Oribacterium asaccharolyticum]|uniref:WavE lipopolysaccharide synthesis family protein n=1 Tax=Oribacterium asaccharolyticum TaxID=1501332 RepID=UPI0028E1BDB4|nr:WavE lipopolysaccharide synthesis family protein [Oribacterium asaccharolyticum]